MRYEIIFSRQAELDLLALRAADRAKALDAIEIHLRYEPQKASKSRIKRLEGTISPQYRLRIDDLRIFYDIAYSRSSGVVEILAIREKQEAMEWLNIYGRRKEDDPGSSE